MSQKDRIELPKYFTCENFVNENTINIFTDCSHSDRYSISVEKQDLFNPNRKFYKKIKGISSYGAITTMGWKVLTNPMAIEYGISVHKGEARGVELGVLEAYRFRSQGFTGNINLFTDSQATLQALLYCYNNWYTIGRSMYDETQYIIYKDGKNEPVKAAEEYYSIIQNIINYNLGLKIYHVSAHKTDSKSELDEAIYNFARINTIPYYTIDRKFINYITACNCDIDSRTRCLLRRVASTNEQFQRAYDIYPVSESAFNETMREYKEITDSVYEEEEREMKDYVTEKDSGVKTGVKRVEQYRYTESKQKYKKKR